MQRIVICGAAGRDFHDFNTVYRGDAGVRVVAFTTTQIPGIDARRYPASLAGDPDRALTQAECQALYLTRAPAAMIGGVVFSASMAKPAARL